METTKKNSPSDSPKYQRRSKDPRKAYVRLRTVLDALEIAAVCHFMEGKTATDKIRRAKEIERQIMPILKELNINFGTGCPPGLNNCGGCCVPYPCPSDF